MVVGGRMCEEAKWHVRGGGGQVGGPSDKRVKEGTPVVAHSSAQMEIRGWRWQWAAAAAYTPRRRRRFDCVFFFSLLVEAHGPVTLSRRRRRDG